MTIQSEIDLLAASGMPISIPFLQRKFKLKYSEAKEIYECFFPPEPVKERFYYFREYWKSKKNERS